MSDSQPRAAPTELRYGDTVPVAIPSEAQRMEFLPTNNGTFTYGQSQVITIDVNVDGFLDVANSMLQCELHNESNGTFCKAPGIAFVKRLRILNSGTVLEDINEYSALYSLLTAVQADESKRTHSIYTNENQFAKATMLPQVPAPGVGSVHDQKNVVRGLGGMTSKGGGIFEVDVETLDSSNVAQGNLMSILTGQPGWSGHVETSPVYPCPTAFVGSVGAVAPVDPSEPINLYTSSSVENSHDNCLRPKASVTGLGFSTEAESALGTTYDQTSDSFYRMQFPIISALFNSTKMIPLCLSTAPLTIEITLCPPRDIGVTYKQVIPLVPTDPATGLAVPTAGPRMPLDTLLEPTEAPYLPTQYSIQNVKFVANVISLGQDFVNQLRQQVSESGSLALHSTAWRHYGATFQGSELNPTINIPARCKSIKTIVTTMRPQSGDGLGGNGDPTLTGDAEHAPGVTHPNGRPWNPWPSTNGTFTTGTRMQMGVSSWQYRCGAAHLPQTSVKLDPSGYASFQGDPVAKRGSGCAASYAMLMQGFGKLNQIDHQTSLSRVCYSQTGNTGCPVADDYLKNFIIAFDAESFGGKATIQSGIDTASRGLPLSLVLEREAAKGNDVPITTDVIDGTPHTFKFGGLNSHDKQDPVLRKAGVDACYVDNPAPKFVQVDSWVAADAFFYFGSDGSIVPSV